MTNIIFGYEINTVWRGGYSFSVYDNGIANTEKLSVRREIIESKKFVVPKSVVEDIKKYLIEQKNLIENLPEKINGFTVDGGWYDFNFLGKQFFCFNISKTSNKEIYEMELLEGKISKDIMESIQQQNAVLEIFESARKFLKDFEPQIYHL
ncbi:MAG: hypothetical protein IJU55_00230 [Selenomonadaceae bacterium]|nr:hypothetical protein [Selenomonadaceae bacterium]